MKKQKVYLEELLDEVRSLSEYYPITNEEGEAFELEPSELKPFTEEVIAAIKRFLTFEDVEEPEEDDEDDLDMFLLDSDDDLS